MYLILLFRWRCITFLSVASAGHLAQSIAVLLQMPFSTTTKVYSETNITIKGSGCTEK